MASSKTSVYSAMIADFLIAITKFVAGGISHSAAMVAEGMHSLVDISNGFLLLFGIVRSKRRPDDIHPFGYGKEQYFWSFIVSIIILGLGGGISLYQGFTHILRPRHSDNATMNYIVLGISFIFELLSMIIPIRRFRREKGALSWWDGLIRSKDPAVFTVLFEDIASVLGLIIVAVSVFLNQQFHLPYVDGVASLLVGLLLIAISLITARESRSLLMGEGIANQTKKAIKELVEKDKAIDKVLHIISSYQSPEEVILMLVVAFKEKLNTDEIVAAIERIRSSVKKEFTRIRYLMVEPQSLENEKTMA